MLWLPDVPFAPLHEPLAVHEVGLLVALHAIVDVLPVPTDVGLAEMLTTGFVAGLPDETLTDVLAVSLPPAFVHFSV